MYKKKNRIYHICGDLWPRDLIIIFRSKLKCFIIYFFFIYFQMIEGNFVIGFFCTKLVKEFFDVIIFSRQIHRLGKMTTFRVQDVRCTLKPYHLHLLAWLSHKRASKILINTKQNKKKTKIKVELLRIFFFYMKVVFKLLDLSFLNSQIQVSFLIIYADQSYQGFFGRLILIKI